jgi:hypothetical protein
MTPSSGQRSMPRLRLAVLALAFAAAWPAAAQTWGRPVPPRDHLRYEVRAGLLYTDNRARRGDAGPEDWILVPELAFSLLRGGERWRAQANGELAAEHSLQGVAGDRLRLRLGARLDAWLVPDRLSWRFEDHADVDAIDPLAPDEPDNRQQLNLFETGPELTLGERGGWQTRLQASWGRGDAEDSETFDHDRVGAAAWLLRQDAVRGWQVGAESTEIDFDGDAADYRRTDALLRFDNQLPLTGVQVSAGRTWLDFRTAPSRSLPLLRAELRWTPRQDTELRGVLLRELSDAGRDLLGGGAIEPDGLRVSRRSTIGPDPYRLEGLEGSLQQRWLRSQFVLSLFRRDYRYLERDLGLDRDSRGGRASFHHALSPRLALQLQAGLERFGFQQLARTDHDRWGALQLEQRIAPRWRLRYGVAHFRRGSDVASAAYRENVAMFHLIYGGGE